LENVWGPSHREDVQYLRVYIGQLREKLGESPGLPKYIVNEPGIGYRLLNPD
jgi:two-component system KDP operon response regulator KdpE